MSEGKSRKIYYTMGEVAEMLDVNITTVRFWESRFSVIKPHRNKKGNRLFTATDVENLKLIYMLVKEQGMTLDGAEKALSGNRDEVVRKAEIIEKLLNVKSMLLEIKQELWSGDQASIIDPQDEYTEPVVIGQKANVETAKQIDEQDPEADQQSPFDGELRYENSKEPKEQTLF